MKIRVTGASNVKHPAEQVVAHFSAIARRPRSQEALGDISQVLAQTRELLDRYPVTGVQFSQLSTWSELNDSQVMQHIAQARGVAQLTDVALVASLIEAVASIEGLNIDWLDWKLSSDTAAQLGELTTAKAYQDAQRQAQWIATAAGYDQLAVLSVSSLTSRGFDSGSGLERAAVLAQDLVIEPTEVTVDAVLEVEFDAKQVNTPTD